MCTENAGHRTPTPAFQQCDGSGGGARKGAFAEHMPTQWTLFGIVFLQYAVHMLIISV